MFFNVGIIMVNFDFLLCVNTDNPYLDLSIQSMLEQDINEEYGIIIIANNCDDLLYDKLDKYREGNNNIYLYRTSVGQVAFNLNYGADLSRADYLVRMDADDICMPNRLSLTKKSILDNDFPDVVSGSINIIDEKGEHIKTIVRGYDEKKLKNRMPFKNLICHPATAIKRDSLLKARGYAGSLNGEDYDLWIRMLRLKFRFVLFPQVVISYRLSSFQIRGSAVAYADGIGVKLREFLLGQGFIYLFGFLFGLIKFFYFKVIGRMKK